jgi:uracil-DNA glycosylase
MQKAEVPYEALGSGMTEQDKDGAIESIGGGWGTVLAARLGETRCRSLEDFLADAWAGQAPVYPSRSHVFAAFDATPLDSVRAVILGQDPYPTEGQACGLAFSVPEVLPPGVSRPRSLGRILKELERERFTTLGRATLDRWTGRKGVLLLNATLTFEKRGPDHAEKWRGFTTAVIQTLAERPDPIAFLLWGKRAQGWAELITSPHRAICAPHPMARGRAEPFVGSCPFRRSNDFLGPERKIDWNLS